MLVRSGQFTGNGSSQSIAGLGFKPDVILIKAGQDSTADTWMTTKDMPVGTALPIRGDVAKQTGYITSLDSDGFTVGSQNATNQNTYPIMYIAFKDDGAGDFSAISFAGDSLDEKSVFTAFKPDYALIKSDQTITGARKWAGMSSTVGSSASSYIATPNYQGSSPRTDLIGFITGGMNVSNGSSSGGNLVNAAGAQSYGFVFKNVSGKFMAGAYTGNGTSQTITTGFQPAFIDLQTNGSGNPVTVYKPQTSTGYSQPFDGAPSTGKVTSTSSTGFTVGSDSNVNTSGTTYWWMAVAESAAAAIAPVASFTNDKSSGYNPLTVQFTDTSIYTPTSWAWTFGDGTSSTAQNPLKTYTSNGTYSVSMTATNATGNNTITKTNLITVTAAPSAVLYIQGAASTTSGYVQTGTATLTGVAPGNFLIVAVATGSAAADFGGISDNMGNTWVKMASTENTKGSSVYYVKSAVGGNTTVSITGNAGGSLDFTLTLREYANVDPVNPIVNFVLKNDTDYVSLQTATITPTGTQNGLVFMSMYSNGAGVASTYNGSTNILNSANGDYSHTASGDVPITGLTSTTGGFNNSAYVKASNYIVELAYYSPGNPKTQTLTDSFNGSSLNTANWTPAGTISVTAGSLYLSYSGTTNSKITTTATYSIKNSYVYIKTDTPFTIRLNATSGSMYYQRLYNGGSSILVGGMYTDDDTTQTPQAAYNAATMKYFRVRNSANTYTLEYGTNGTTWTTLGTLADTYLSPAAVTVSLEYPDTTSAIQEYNSISIDPPPLANNTNRWYAYGVLPTGKTVAALRTITQNWWTAHVLPYIVSTGMPSGMTAGAQRVYRPENSNDTVSEGMGYVMIGAVWMNEYDANAHTIFDNLFKYVKYYYNARGMMSWHIDSAGGIIDTGSATDADYDIAWALHLASQKWGNAGAVNYAAERDSYLAAMLANDFYSATHATTSLRNAQLNGDQWDPSQTGTPNKYDPDYVAPMYYTAWTPLNARWNDIKVKNYQILGAIPNTTTGLFPDRMTREGGPASGENYISGYNSVRRFRHVSDYLNFGSTQGTPYNEYYVNKEVADFMATKSGNVPANLRAEWAIDGSTSATYLNSLFASAYMVSMLVNGDHSQLAADTIDWIVAHPDGSYFGDTVAFMNLGTAAGYMTAMNEGDTATLNTDYVNFTFGAVSSTYTKNHTTDLFKRKQFTRTHTTDAFKRFTLTRSHSTDTVKRVSSTRVHSTDTLKRRTAVLSHFTDVNKNKAGLTRAHSTDTLKRASTAKSHSTDVSKRVIFVRSHSTDTLKRVLSIRTHSTDLATRRNIVKVHSTDVLKRAVAVRTHSTDTVKRAIALRLHATDVNKRKAGITLAHTTDTNKRKSAILKSHTTDVAKRTVISRFHTTDTLKRKQYVLSHSTDTLKRVLGVKAFSTDTLKRKSFTKTHSTDTVKRTNLSRFHTTDTLKRVRLTRAHTTDSLLRRTYPRVIVNDDFTATGTGTWDQYSGDGGMQMRDTGTYNSAPAALMFSGSLMQTAIQRPISGLVIGKTYYVRAWVRGTAGQTLAFQSAAQNGGLSAFTTMTGAWQQMTWMFVASATSGELGLYSPAAAQTFYLDDVLLYEAFMFTTDVNKTKRGVRAHSTDTNKRKGTTRTHFTDINKTKSGIARSHSTDILKRKAFSLSHSTDTVKRALFVKSFLTDTLKRKSTAISHSTDVNKLKSGNLRAFTTDTNKRKVAVVSQNTDVLKRKLNAVSHSTDVLKRKAFSRTHTTDVLRRTINVRNHSTDIVKRSLVLRTHTTDVNKRSRNVLAFTTDVNKRRANIVLTHTTDVLKRSNNLRAHSTDLLKRSNSFITQTTDVFTYKRNIKSYSTDVLKRQSVSKTHTTDSAILYARRINYVPNPNVDTNITGWSVGGFPNSGSVSQSTDWSHSGTSSVLATGSLDNTGSHGFGGIAIPIATTVVVGQTYTMSIYVNITDFGGTGNFAYVKFYWGNSSTIGATTSVLGPQRLTVTGTAPVGATIIQSQVFVQGTNGARPYMVYADDALLEIGSTVGSYFDGDSLNANWRGVPENSQSYTTAYTFNPFHTTDVSKKKAGIVRTHSVDVNKQKSGVAKTHTTDTLKRNRNLRTFTTDTIKRKNFTKVHTTDIVKRAKKTLIFKTDTFLRDQVQLPHSTDVNLKDRTTVQHGTDVFTLGKNALFHNTNTNLRERDIVAHNTDVNLRKTSVVIHGTSVAKKVALTRSHTTGTNLRKANVRAHLTDINKRKASTKPFTTDVNKRKATLRTHLTDVNKRKSGILKVHTTDTNKRKLTIKLHTTDTVKRTINTVAFTTDVVKRLGSSRFHTTDVNKRKTAITIAHSTDLQARKSGLLKSHTTDVVRRANIVKTHFTDVVKRKAIAKTHTTDVLKRKNTAKVFTTDIVKKKISTRTFTTDTLKRKNSTKAFTTSVNKRKVTTKVHSTDVLKRKSIAKTHNTDIVKKSLIVLVHSTDIIKRVNPVLDHSTDTLLRSNATLQHSTDTYTVRRFSKSHSTDVYIFTNFTGRKKVLIGGVWRAKPVKVLRNGVWTVTVVKWKTPNGSWKATHG